MHKLETILEWGGIKRELVFLLISGAALMISGFGLVLLPLDAAWAAIILCGSPIILDAVIGLVTAFDIKADVLVSIALAASIMTGEIFAAGEVAFIMQLGALLEALTVAKARAGIENLVHLTPCTARVIAGADETIIPADQVKAGHLLRVLPGETIPADGVIITGQTCVNQAVMTGESLPVDKGAGDEVYSGTVNQFGSFDMEAVKAGEDSSIQRMVRLVRSADAGKAKIASLADKWSAWIVVIALTAAALTWITTGKLIRAVTILVVFCPCALVLATPAAIMAAIGNAARHGFLVREGDALERLASVSKFTFDKTGTLTLGTPQVTCVHSFLADSTEEMIYALAASAEMRSEHPLGKAVVRCYRASTGKDIVPAEQFQLLPGRGVQAFVKGNEIKAGNLELLNECQTHCSPHSLASAGSYQNQGCTIIYLVINNRPAGFLALSDTLRPESAEMIAQLKKAGVSPVLLTGDHSNAARCIAKQLWIDEIYANCLPEDKLNYIDISQKEHREVCMIGDGINDAPALKRACVGIAMGGIGSDIAADAAGIVLVDDEIKELPHLLRLARHMMFTIKCNLSFSMTLNLIAMILAMTGILNPVFGALVHNAGSVAVIINSVFLLRWREKSLEKSIS